MDENLEVEVELQLGLGLVLVQDYWAKSRCLYLHSQKLQKHSMMSWQSHHDMLAKDTGIYKCSSSNNFLC